MDAMDIGIVDIDKDRLDVIHYEQYAFQEELRKEIRQLNAESSIAVVARLDIKLARAFADAVLNVLAKLNISPVDITATGHHGQTILHLVNQSEKCSWQIGDANTLACNTGIDTVTDFRGMDIASGGQGAPLTSAFHARYFRSTSSNRVILNIGGIANITILPSDPDAPVQGFDTGPGNGLLDDWNHLHNNTVMDKDGRWANSGAVIKELLDTLLADHYFKLPPPKSTGRDDFNLDWLNRHINPAMRAVDVQATLLHLSALTINRAINEYASECDEIYLCGGGAHNKALVNKLQSLMRGIRIESTRALGVDPDAVEAVTFAWLAHCRVNRIPIALKTITGATTDTLSGALYAYRRTL